MEGLRLGPALGPAMLRQTHCLLVALAGSFVIVVVTAPAASADCTADPVTGEVVCDDEDGGERRAGGGDPEVARRPADLRRQRDPVHWARAGRSGAAATGAGSATSGIPVGRAPSRHLDRRTRTVRGTSATGRPLAPRGIQSGSQNGTVTIDPVVLANRAIASMDLDPITIGIVPESGPNRVGLVGLPVWMWVDNQTDDTCGPITGPRAKDRSRSAPPPACPASCGTWVTAPR